MTAAVVGRLAEVVAPRTFSIREHRFDLPLAGHVQVKVTHVGICASDLSEWRTGPGADQAPLRLGHEPVGVVHAVGDGVTGLHRGQTVTGRFVPSFADYVIADATDVVTVPDAVDPAVALGEPLGCVVEGYRRAAPAVGARTAVVGLGFMGLVMTQLLVRSPTAAVWAVDLREDALAAAAGCGATRVFQPGDAELGVSAVDLVVEATGTQAGLDLATSLVAEHGTLAILGYHQAPSREIDLQTWNWKALDVVNAHVRDRRRLTDATRAGLRLLAAGRLDLRPLVSHHYPLERIDAAYRALEHKPPGFVKAVVTL